MRCTTLCVLLSIMCAMSVRICAINPIQIGRQFVYIKRRKNKTRVEFTRKEKKSARFDVSKTRSKKVLVTSFFHCVVIQVHYKFIFVTTLRDGIIRFLSTKLIKITLMYRKIHLRPIRYTQSKLHN